MSRPLFPEGTEVHASALQAGVNDARFQLQQRQVDSTTSGRVEGLVITIGTPASRFTLSAGRAYTPRGDLLEFAGSSNFALADYTTAVENLVCLAYRETPGTTLAHELDGTAQNTLVSRSSELIVLTRAEYDDTLATEDVDLETNLVNADVSTNAQDRLVIVAIILGKGIPGGTPTTYIAGDFTNGNINQQAHLSTIKTASFDSLPSPLSGVNIKNISSGTPLGFGDLAWFSGTTTFRWTAPGEAQGPSSAVTMTNEIQELTLSATGGSTITIEVIPDLLPSSNTNDAVEISVMYVDDGPVFSADDDLHRGKLGEYVPTDNNPHGLGYADLAQQVAVIGRPMLLGADALSTESEALMARILTPMSTAGGVDRTLMWELSGGSSWHQRFYRTSVSSFEITTNAEWNGTQWVLDTAAQDAFKLAISNGVMSVLIYTAGTTPFNDADFASTFTTTESAMAQLGAGFLTSISSSLIPRISVDYFDAARTLILESPADTTGVPYRIYARASGFEITANAEFTVGSVWQKADTAQEACKIQVSAGQVEVMDRAAGAGTWNDASWTNTLTINPSVGVTALDYIYPAAHSITTFFPAISGQYAPASGALADPDANAYWIKVGSGNGNLYIPLVFPNGATITSARLSHSTDGAAWTFNIRRHARTGAPASASLSTGGAVTLPDQTTLTNLIHTNFNVIDQFNVVDNTTYFYSCTVALGSAADEIRVAGVEVTYTITELGN